MNQVWILGMAAAAPLGEFGLNGLGRNWICCFVGGTSYKWSEGR